MLTIQELLPAALTLAAVVATYFYLNAKSNNNKTIEKTLIWINLIFVEEILNPKVFKSFRLIEKIPVSHNTSK